jgi:hypothetical protein
VLIAKMTSKIRASHPPKYETKRNITREQPNSAEYQLKKLPWKSLKQKKGKLPYPMHNNFFSNFYFRIKIQIWKTPCSLIEYVVCIFYAFEPASLHQKSVTTDNSMTIYKRKATEHMIRPTTSTREVHQNFWKLIDSHHTISSSGHSEPLWIESFSSVIKDW